MNHFRITLHCLISLYALLGAAYAQDNPYVGSWALTTEGGGAGWLEIRRDAGVFDGALLWVGGSPEPFTRVYFDGATLHGLRVRTDEIRDAAGKVARTQVHPINLTATLAGDEMRGELVEPTEDGTSVIHQAFTGKRMPPPPAPPDLSSLRFGEPVALFNGKDLDGWVAMGGPHWGSLEAAGTGAKGEGWIPFDRDVVNGWSVVDGVLSNNPVQQEGQPYIRYGNLQTEAVFEDFNLTLEVKVPADGNSGVYLRGIYEIQLRDSFGKPLDSHNMGALYGRITPSAAAEKPAGEWQTLDITLAERHLTVKLNGQTIIENRPVEGCTGGALWSDPFRPGPIYFQGDHTGVALRNIVLRPILK